MDQAEILNELYKNAKMGEQLIKRVLDQVEDGDIKDDLLTQMAGYTDLYARAQSQLADLGVKPDENNLMTRVMSDVGVRMNLLADHTPQHVAEMMIQGSNMGIIDADKSLNQCDNMPGKVKTLVEDVKKFEQTSIQKLKSYL